MSKIFLIILVSILLNACDHQENPSDDYVLIEFASKLEEDYSKLDQSQNKK